jgi:hypothetical protein
MSFAAGDLRSGEAEVLAQDLRERAPDRRVEGVRLAVDQQLRQV